MNSKLNTIAYREPNEPSTYPRSAVQQGSNRPPVTYGQVSNNRNIISFHLLVFNITNFINN